MYKVVSTEIDQDFTIVLDESQLQIAQQNGIYPLVNDLSFEVNQMHQLRFEGLINGQTVVTQNYTVSTDCCHVSLVSGHLEIQIN